MYIREETVSTFIFSRFVVTLANTTLVVTIKNLFISIQCIVLPQHHQPSRKYYLNGLEKNLPR